MAAQYKRQHLKARSCIPDGAGPARRSRIRSGMRVRWLRGRSVAAAATWRRTKWGSRMWGTTSSGRKAPSPAMRAPPPRTGAAKTAPAGSTGKEQEVACAVPCDPETAASRTTPVWLLLRQPSGERDSWLDPFHRPHSLNPCLLSWLEAPQIAHVLALQLEGGAALSREPQTASATRGLPRADRRRPLE